MVLCVRKDAMNENIKRESKGPKASGLGKEQADLEAWLATGNGFSEDSDNGREWGRCSSKLSNTEQLSLFDRVQESGKVQRSIRHPQASLDSYGCRVRASWLHKDESPETDSGT